MINSPHLRISRHYRELMKQSDTQADVRDYIRDLHSLRRPAHQKIAQRRPFTASQRKSSVCSATFWIMASPPSPAGDGRRGAQSETARNHDFRCVANNICKPLRCFEMKYFTLAQNRRRRNGLQQTVQDMIKNIVIREDPAQPLSDQEIQARLQEEGIQARAVPSIGSRLKSRHRTCVKFPESAGVAITPPTPPRIRAAAVS